MANISNCLCDNIEVSNLNDIPVDIDLTIIHINIRSIQKNIDPLIELLSKFTIPPHIIAISETKLHTGNSHSSNISIDGYRFIHTPSASKAGGVGAFIRNDITYCEVSDYQLNYPNSEDLWFEISLTNVFNNMSIGIIYKHPRSDIPEFTSIVENCMSKLSKKHFIIVGDLNINLLASNTNTQIASYSDMLTSYNAISLISKPTRVTRSSSTLIDHMYSNMTDVQVNSYVISSDITDHFPIMCCLKGIKPSTINDVILSRDMSSFSIDEFRIYAFYCLPNQPPCPIETTVTSTNKDKAKTVDK
uniref:uncharacterized protein LOC120329750 n=1 Tax=Styela clava TaxID=7725 RepID=UPI0019396C12|nr:uncharacterized protein LOC120329750 [Styela clava]